MHRADYTHVSPVVNGLTVKTSSCPCISLRWRHNERDDSVSNHQPHDCLLNRLFRHRSKKTSKLRVTGLCVGNSPGTGEFPAQMASYAENVSIWWHHHVLLALARRCILISPLMSKQGKSEGFDSCDRPSNLTKNWIPITDFSAWVTLKFDGWPRKTNWSYSPEMLNLGQNWPLFLAVWPWNLMDDLVKQ